MHRHPQTLARKMVVDLHIRSQACTKAIGLPIKFSATPGRTGGPPPVLGEHTREVLAEGATTAEEIDALLACGAAHGC